MVQIPTADIEAVNSRLNKKKETRIYYRQHTMVAVKDKDTGEVIKPEYQVWIATRPLPADPWHLNYYTKKGFKLWPPGKEPGQEEVTALQGQVQELEDKAKALKEATAESITAKVEIETEVKALEELAANLKAQAGGVKAPTSEGKISCPVADCTAVVKTYLGLARHMNSKHGTK